jgi:hypothetical protein
MEMFFCEENGWIFKTVRDVPNLLERISDEEWNAEILLGKYGFKNPFWK